MNSELAKKLFIYKDGELIWNSRPLSDFPNMRIFKIINSRNSGKTAGMVNTSGYKVIGYASKLYLAHRIIWMMFYGDIEKNILIDHIDCDTKNNKIENLRLSTKSTNGMNSKMPSHNKSGVKGVCWYEARKKWVAQVKSHDKKFIKHFSSKEDAIKWVDIKRIELHKEYTNFG